MDTKQVGEKLVSLCRAGKNQEAIDSLYSKDIVSTEAQGSPEMPAQMKGLEAIRGKNKWWTENHEVHSASVEGPFVNGDRFATLFQYDITPKNGARKGQRTQMKEVAVYTVKNGKVTHEEFLY